MSLFSSGDAWGALTPLFSCPAFLSVLFGSLDSSLQRERRKALTALRAVRLVNTSWRAAVDAALPHFVGRLTPSDTRALRLLCRVGEASTLTTLCLSRTRGFWPSALLSLPCLTSLDLSDCDWLDGRLLDTLLSKSPGVRSLSLARCIDGSLADSQLLFVVAPQLTSLDLECSFVMTDLAALYRLLPLLSSCERLNIASFLEQGERAGSETFFALRQLAEHRRLERLDMSNCGDAFVSDPANSEEAVELSQALLPLIGVLRELWLCHFPYHNTEVEGFLPEMEWCAGEEERGTVLAVWDVDWLGLDFDESGVAGVFAPPHISWGQLHRLLRQPDWEGREYMETRTQHTLTLALGETHGVALRYVDGGWGRRVWSLPDERHRLVIQPLSRRILGPGLATAWSPHSPMRFISLLPSHWELHCRLAMLSVLTDTFQRAGLAQPLRLFTVRCPIRSYGAFACGQARPHTAASLLEDSLGAARATEAGPRARLYGLPGDSILYGARVDDICTSYLPYPLCVCSPPGDVQMAEGGGEGRYRRMKPHDEVSPRLRRMFERVVAEREANPGGVPVADWVRAGDLCRAWGRDCARGHCRRRPAAR